VNAQDFKFDPPLWLVNLARTLLIIGSAVFLLGLIFDPQRVWANVLLVSVFLLGIGLGSVFLVAGLQLCSAKWANAIRGLPEKLWVFIAIGGIGVLVTVLFRPSLYPWHDPTPEALHHLHGFRAMWLDRSFFIARTVVFLGIWILQAKAIVKSAGRSPDDRAPSHGRWSALYIVVLMLTVWMAVSDWIMSLDPMFYSTMFGMYCFAGFFASALAVIILLAVWLRDRGPWRNVLTEAHLHDLGKLQFGFCTFWMYIWFSQYMLVWYTNNPEETSYFIQRIEGAWMPLFVLNLFLNWIVPFFALLSVRAKRSASIMSKVVVVVLIGHWLDLYLMILPTIQHGGLKGAETAGLPFGIWEIGIAAGGLGLFIFVFLRTIARTVVKTDNIGLSVSH